MKKWLAVTSVLILLLTPLVTLQPTIAKAQSRNQAPTIEWQRNYGKYSHLVLEPSNLIQTSDKGYAFMDIGYIYFDADSVQGATIFKVDFKGNVQWKKNISNFIGSTIIQTSDKGYEISGWWLASATAKSYPTLIKTDSHGNIQWNQNYTTLPNLDSNYYYPNEMFPYAFGGIKGSSIRTSDGGLIVWTISHYAGGNIIKTDSNNNTQWIDTLNYTIPTSSLSAPLILTSVIETSDGAIAALGVAPQGYVEFPTMGIMYFVKLEPSLPVPSPAQLPTPIPTVPEFSCLIILPLLVALPFIVVILRHRKTANLKQ